MALKHRQKILLRLLTEEDFLKRFYREKSNNFGLSSKDIKLIRLLNRQEIEDKAASLKRKRGVQTEAAEFTDKTVKENFLTQNSQLSHSRNRTYKALKNKNLLASLELHITGMGLKIQNQNIKFGLDAFVLDVGKNRVLRVCQTSLEPPRDSGKLSLQPLKTSVFRKKYKLELLPKIKTLNDILESEELSARYNLSTKKIGSALKHLLEDNLARSPSMFFYDIRPNNACLMLDKNGKSNCYISDAGALIQLQNATFHEFSKFVRHLIYYNIYPASLLRKHDIFTIPGKLTGKEEKAFCNSVLKFLEHIRP